MWLTATASRAILAWLEGKSMLPVIRGEAKEINDEVFAEVTYHAAYEPKLAVPAPHDAQINNPDGASTNETPDRVG